MFDEGLLAQDPDGTYRAVRDVAESEQIKSEVSMTKRRHAMTAAEAEQINANLERLDDDLAEYAME